MNQGAVGEEQSEPEHPDFHSLINEIRSDVLAAHDWYRENLPEMLPAVEGIVRTLSTYGFSLSNDLGEAGFKCDEDQKVMIFNAHVLSSLWRIAGELAAQHTHSSDPQAGLAMQRNAIALYVLHESVHIAQNFAQHELAKILKSAFGADELSKFDLVADIAAVNVNTLATIAASGRGFDTTDYMKTYAGNLLLSYELLRRGFKTAGVDHKKKRALGLLTSLALTRLAIESNDPGRREKLLAIATTPAFTSIDVNSGTIVAITCCTNPGGWKHLFSAKASPETISFLWADPGDASPERALGILLAAYRSAEIPNYDD